MKALEHLLRFVEDGRDLDIQLTRRSVVITNRDRECEPLRGWHFENPYHRVVAPTVEEAAEKFLRAAGVEVSS